MNTDKQTDFAAAIAWLASSENTDAELRYKASHVLDALYYISHLHSPTAGRAPMRKPPRQQPRPLCTTASGAPTGE